MGYRAAAARRLGHGASVLSDIIREAIQQQINADMGEGRLVTGWLVVATYVGHDDEPNTTGYGIIADETQPYHSSLGLIDYARRHFTDDDED